jgi:uncharacterized coiled-coil protein SlyX
MEKITFKISREDLIEELQDDCKELEREIVKTKIKLKSLGELVQSYSEQFENIHEIDDDVVEEIIEGISLILLDNVNSLERYLDDRANKK